MIKLTLIKVILKISLGALPKKKIFKGKNTEMGKKFNWEFGLLSKEYGWNERTLHRIVEEAVQWIFGINRHCWLAVVYLQYLKASLSVGWFKETERVDYLILTSIYVIQ